MAALINEIALFLLSQSLGTLGTDLFYGQLTSTPNNQIAVIDSGGQPNNQSNVSISIITILLRNSTFDSGLAKVLLLQSALHNKTNLLSGVAGTSHAVGFSSLQRLPLYMDVDETGRHLWSIECILNVK